MASTTYRIADEPTPGRMASWVVDPSIVWLASVFGGSWLALPWFVFNAHAMGSVEKKRETQLALLSAGVALFVAFALEMMVRALGVHPAAIGPRWGTVLGLPPRSYAYVAVTIIAIKSAFAYAIQFSQAKSFAIHQYLNGRTRSAAALLGVAYVLRPYVIKGAFQLSVWLGWLVL